MQDTTMIEFWRADEDDAFAVRQWPHAPAPGDSVSLDGDFYVVETRTWGGYVDGQGAPLHGECAVALTVAPDFEADERPRDELPRLRALVRQLEQSAGYQANKKLQRANKRLQEELDRHNVREGEEE